MASRREDIIQDLKTALLGMSQGSGYSRDYQHVYEWLDGDPEDWPVLFIMEGPEDDDDSAYPVTRHDLTLSVMAEDHVDTSITDAPAVEARRMIADIRRAVLADPTRATNAWDTKPVRAEPPLIFDNTVIVEVQFLIIYRTSREEPDTVV